MRKIKFSKMVASGNDFVVIQEGRRPEARRYKFLARNICNRKYGIGADGLLVLEKSKNADIKMRIFNADGSEAEMCGNGARCAAVWLGSQSRKVAKSHVDIETKAGIIKSQINGDKVRIKLTDPKGLKLGIPIKVNGRNIRVNFINTGVPHTVIFVEGLDKIDIFNMGRGVRYHKQFAPKGTNVNFMEVLGKHSIKVRTYERGVEDETLACGTGAAAAAIITSGKLANGSTGSPSLEPSRAKSRDWQTGKQKINIHTKGGEILKVYFDRTDNRFHNVWLEGLARIAYKGVYNV
ncbi:MAG: diaminopimelate epimerase [Candidatus Omnitrophota bacterium]